MLVVVRSGILARTIPVAIAGRELTINQDLKAIVPRRQIDQEFLAHFLRASESKLLRLVTRGATVHRLTTDILKALPIPVPSLEEQRQIVAVLEEAFESLDRAQVHVQANLQDTLELLDSIEEGLFSPVSRGFWITDRLENCLKVKSGEFLPRKDMTEEGSIPVYGGNGVVGYHDRSNLSGENVLIGRVGAKCGNVHRVSEPIWLTDNALYVSEMRRDFDDDFMALLLKRAKLRRTANQAAQPVISYKTIKPVELTFPVDTEEQERIVDRYTESRKYCDQLTERHNAKLACLENLRQSLLQRAFAGELT